MRRRFPLLLVVVLGSTLLMVPSAPAYTYDPPPWFEDGLTLLRKREAKCETERGTRPLYSDSLPGEGPTITSHRVRCLHKLPFIRPGSLQRYEMCEGYASEVTVETYNSRYYYLCWLVGRGPKTGKKRTPWECSRHSNSDNPDYALGRIWISEATRHYRFQRFKTLEQCQNPRLRRLLY